jgi:hypothetical protein
MTNTPNEPASPHVTSSTTISVSHPLLTYAPWMHCFKMPLLSRERTL